MKQGVVFVLCASTVLALSSVLAQGQTGKAGKSLFEYACHEGNYQLPSILRGARKAEAAARQGAP